MDLHSKLIMISFGVELFQLGLQKPQHAKAACKEVQEF